MKTNDFIAKLRGFGAIFATLVSLFILIVAPIEISKIRHAKTAPIIEATYLGSFYKNATFRRSQKYLVLNFTNENQKNIEVVDLRPGDFPFSMDIFGAIIMDTNRDVVKSLQIGQKYKLIQSKSQNKYFLERGNYTTMSLLLFLSISWLGFVFYFINRSRQTAK